MTQLCMKYTNLALHCSMTRVCNAIFPLTEIKPSLCPKVKITCIQMYVLYTAWKDK
jgi:hypothetical protein